MAAPVDAARATTNITSASTLWNVNYPTGIVAGDLLLTFFRTATGAIGGPPSAWTQLGSYFTGDASDDATGIYWKVAAGGESGTLSYDWSGSTKGAAIMWRITGAVDPAEVPLTVSTEAVGTGANACNPGSVAPTGAPKDTLYVAMGGYDGETGAFTAAPTNYSNLAAANSGTGGAVATNCIIGGATRGLTASSSEDPGAFTHGTPSSGWTGLVVAVPAVVLIQNVTPIQVQRAMGLGARY